MSGPVNDFGRWLQEHGISYASAARALEVTRSYIHSLATSKSNPTIPFADKIEEWSKSLDPTNFVNLESWRPKRRA